MAALEADAKRRTREWDERRALNHHLAHLIAFAHHDPKKMPEFKPTEPDKPKARDPATDLAQVRGYLKGLSLRGKKAGK